MVSDVVLAAKQGTPVSEELFDAVISDAVDIEVERQKRIGMNVVGRRVLQNHIRKLCSAPAHGVFRRQPACYPSRPRRISRRCREVEQSQAVGLVIPPAFCTGPVAVRTRAPVEGDIRRMQAAVAKHKPNGAFLTAASPGLIAIFHPNRFYPTPAAYLRALATAMREEYRSIIEAGLSSKLLSRPRHGPAHDFQASQRYCLLAPRRRASRGAQLRRCGPAARAVEDVRLLGQL